MSCPICGYRNDMDARSRDQLALYWLLLGLVCEYQTAPVFQGKDGKLAFHDTLKVALGYVQPVFGMNGEVKTWKPKSIAMNKMNSQEFCDYFDKVKSFIFGSIIPAVQQPDFEKRVLEMLSERWTNDQ